MFAAQCRCIVVVGAQWGDEGKGKLVDVLAEGADLVVRYQGGANAGHTVVVGDVQFILQQIPSGILHPRARCIVGNGVVLDPETFFTELDHLEAKGINTTGRIQVSDRAHLVLPYHKLLDQAREKSQNIGTTGRGIGPTYEDKYGRRGVRVGDLRNPEVARNLMAAGLERANALLAMLGASTRADLAAHEDLLARLGPRLTTLATDTGLVIHQAIRKGERVLLEGAQGALLDVDHGTYPFVTSSNTTAGGAAVGAGIGPMAIEGVLGVVKAYTTRVGNGPLPSAADPADDELLRKLGGEFGAVTGRARRCGWFDAVVVRYSARVNGLSHLAVTKLDVLDTIAELPVCIGYEIDGERTDELPSDVGLLDRIKPVYRAMKGWQVPIDGARRLEDLPREARGYLDLLEELVGVPIRYVSVGTRRDQIIAVE